LQTKNAVIMWNVLIRFVILILNLNLINSLTGSNTNNEWEADD